MFINLTTPVQDFEQQLDACINAMAQNDATGQTLVFERLSGALHMRHIDPPNLVDANIDRYEMVVFDGGNTHGDCWKHVFFSTTARAFFRVRSLTPSPSPRGIFVSEAKRLLRDVVSCKPNTSLKATLAHMFVGVADTCPGNQDLRGCECVKPHWSCFFSRTHCVHPHHPQGTSPLWAGSSLVFLTGDPYGP